MEHGSCLFGSKSVWRTANALKAPTLGLIEDHLSSTYADRLCRQYPANSASTTDYPAPTSIPRVVFLFLSTSVIVHLTNFHPRKRSRVFSTRICLSPSVANCKSTACLPGRSKPFNAGTCANDVLLPTKDVLLFFSSFDFVDDWGERVVPVPNTGHNTTSFWSTWPGQRW